MGDGSHFIALFEVALACGDDDRTQVSVCGIAKVAKSIEHRYERLRESLESRLASVNGVKESKT